MSGETILIVDDSPVNLKLLRVLLTLEGYDVRTAVDADDALATLATFHPRLILMDLQLPGMSGLELTARLKAAPATQKLRIIAVTAYAMKGDEQKARAAGCDGYLTKPIDARTLLRIVAHHLQERGEPCVAAQ